MNMETATTTKAAPGVDTRKSSERTRRQLNNDFVKLQDGIFVGFVLGNFEQKHSAAWGTDFTTIDLKRESGEVISVVLDGGLRGALKMSKIIVQDVDGNFTVIAPDTMVEIEFNGKIEVENGMANSYKVYILE
jgi:hypothetical protein